MSKRIDIIDPTIYTPNSRGLIYTEVLGWIDLGHALGNDIRDILFQFQKGEATGSHYYLIHYEQTMRNRYFGTGRHIRWNIKRGRSLSERHSIALAMMMQTASLFESWQSMPWFSWYTDSGFSAEDMVSDLLGFYNVIQPMNYFSLIKPVSKESALRRWDYYGSPGDYKNTGFRPLLFPDPIDKLSRLKPYKSNLPGFMTTIEPFTDFSSDVVRVIDKASIITEIGTWRVP
ncbi:hypothetical protein PMPD1_0290 [Paramixta manurensis]|uniref:DUF4056 domain-containing protein n=1 Tax=Paramixta manurensis TaxID=2740817 RepID=A0A6M8U8Y6_9GAMM|nr:hypothetical protein PMPD1_0290 [Erwiniaceae bacterium PD-1]